MAFKSQHLQNQYTSGSQAGQRRAYTEMPDHNQVEAYDINQLPDSDPQDPRNRQAAPGVAVAEDVDDIDYNNYKGIYANDEGQKYQCPETGAHFEFNDLCRRMSKILNQREADWERYYGYPKGMEPTQKA